VSGELQTALAEPPFGGELGDEPRLDEAVCLICSRL
jgi:hypothetical protein